MAYAEHIYRAEGDLKSFRIRVDLTKVSQGGGKTIVRAGSNAQEPGESYIFSWQKKAFSQREYEFYGDAYNCTSAIESKYNRDIAKLRQEGGRKNGRLFCYIEGDQPNIPAELRGSPHAVEPSQLEPTFATQYFSSAIRRRRAHQKQLLRGVGDEGPVLDRPSMEQRLAHRINTPSLQSMYIMADLHHTVEGIEIWEEHLLCLIQVDDSGVVSVKPHFNSGQTPYRIETRNRDVYEYSLQQVVDPVPPEHTAQERSLQEELHRRKAEQLQNLIGTQFTDPPEGGALSVVLLGEIVSAQGFEYNDLYITAQLQLPEFWEVCGDQELSVVTQISRTRSKHLYNVANFNCPFEYHLIYHNITTVEDDLAHWPCVLVEVCSLDSWDRHRVEGYGHLTLPSSPGVHEMVVGTWRPSGSAAVDRLRRFFVGGTSRLSDVSYISRPSDFEGRHLSKYGFQTESSGTVNFRFNIIHQSSSSVQRFQSEQLNCAISRHGGLRTSLAATLDVFQRARQKAASVTATLN